MRSVHGSVDAVYAAMHGCPRVREALEEYRVIQDGVKAIATDSAMAKRSELTRPIERVSRDNEARTAAARRAIGAPKVSVAVREMWVADTVA